MSSITVHNLDKEMDQLIRELAAGKKQSLNKTIKFLLRDALNLSPNKKKSDFSNLCGVWSKEEMEEFDKRTEEMFERVHPEDWQ